MKKFLVLIAIVAVSVGCQTKLEKARSNMIRTWKISKVFEDGVDVTTVFTNSLGNYRIGFDGDGRFTETFNPFNGNIPDTVKGTWAFTDGINKFTLTDDNLTRIYQIDALTESTLNITDLGSPENTELQLVPI